MTGSTAFRGSSLLLLAVLGACGSTPPPASAEPIRIDGAAEVLDGERYREVRVGVHVAAAPDEVWALLTDAASYPDWNSTVVSIEGTIARGEQIALVSTVDPERTFELWISAFEPPRRLVWEDGGRAFRGVRTFTLTARDDGTTDVTMAEVFTGAMMGMIADKLPDFRPSFDAFAADLKRAAERGGEG